MQGVKECDHLGPLQQIGVDLRADGSIVAPGHGEVATHFKALSSSSNRIFKAVPMPETCSFPHKRHLSHPTQSMMRDTFLKWLLNCSLSNCSASVHARSW